MIPVPWSPPGTKGFFLSLSPHLRGVLEKERKKGRPPPWRGEGTELRLFLPLPQLQEAAAAAAAAPRMGFWAEEGGGEEEGGAG